MMSRAERDLRDAFEEASKSSPQQHDSSKVSRPLPPHPFTALQSEIPVMEKGMLGNARSLDAVVCRLMEETDDRIAWLQRLKAAISDEEHCMRQRRRSCIELQMISERHRVGVEHLVERFGRHVAHDVEHESLAAREEAMEQRGMAVQQRTDDVLQLFKTLDARERELANRTAELSRIDDLIEAQQREVSAEARALKAFEYEYEDRLHALERREEAISLWESRLDRREADLNKAVGITGGNKALRIVEQRESIEIDD